MALPGDPAAPDRSDGTPGPDLLGADWPRQATDQVVKVVDQVREKTTGPVLSGSRIVVYGLVAAVAATLAGLLALIGALRLVNELTDRVWLTYLIFGVLFLAIGAFCWSRREGPAVPTSRIDGA